jgi:hypothetical protein
MDQLFGAGIVVFVFITLILVGFAAFMSGQALADTWRPWWQTLPYSLGLGVLDRFLTWALFQGPLFAPLPYLLDTAILFAICLLAYRLTQARKIVTQYPWIYERTGPFNWRPKDAQPLGDEARPRS